MYFQSVHSNCVHKAICVSHTPVGQQALGMCSALSTGRDYTGSYYSAMNTLITLHHMCSLGDCMYTWASEYGHMKALTVQLPVQVMGVWAHTNQY